MKTSTLSTRIPVTVAGHHIHAANLVKTWIIALAITIMLTALTGIAGEIPSEFTNSCPQRFAGESPKSVTVKAGETATFTLDSLIISNLIARNSTDTNPPTFQWCKNGNNQNAHIAGATNASYTTPPATLEDNNSSYVCLFNGSVISFNALTVAWLHVYGEGEKILDWVKVAEHATWGDRDSLLPVVYNDKMWIFEGWLRHNTMTADVWNSTDGATWNFVIPQGPWKDTDFHSTVVFNDKMWLMGGVHTPDGTYSNEVYSSTDGANWRVVTTHAAWSGRSGADLTVFNGKMWLTGGQSGPVKNEAYSSEVWSSSNGVTWVLATANPGWGPRSLHHTAVLNGKLYLFGGVGGTGNDVWSSDDGIQWNKLIDHAPWYSRFWFSSVVYRNRMWVMGAGSENGDDVWCSKDGINWRQIKSKAMWRGRHAHGAVVLRDKIFIFGGSTFRWGHEQPDNDVWSLEVPKDWFDDK